MVGHCEFLSFARVVLSIGSWIDRNGRGKPSTDTSS